MHFYSHLISVNELIIELDSLDLSDKERKHLASLLDDNLHSTILDAVFSELGDDDKQTLIQYINEDNKSKIWELLNTKVDAIEDKIKNAAEELKREMKKDLINAKVIKNKNLK